MYYDVFHCFCFCFLFSYKNHRNWISKNDHGTWLELTFIFWGKPRQTWWKLFLTPSVKLRKWLFVLGLYSLWDMSLFWTDWFRFWSKPNIFLCFVILSYDLIVDFSPHRWYIIVEEIMGEGWYSFQESFYRGKRESWFFVQRLW